MKELVIIASLLGSYTVTSYRSIPSQTDESPFYTSTGEHVHPHGIAVSQDWLKKNGGPLNYGDLIYIEDVGYKFINDAMNKRWTNRFDVWVNTIDDERKFFKRFGHRKLRVWIVKRVSNEKERRRSTESY